MAGMGMGEGGEVAEAGMTGNGACQEEEEPEVGEAEAVVVADVADIISAPSNSPRYPRRRSVPEWTSRRYR
jgi:hypothetical protein